MTRRDKERLDEAEAHTEESERQAERDMAAAEQRSSVWMSYARRLRELREANGFRELFDQVMEGGHGATGR